MRDLLRDARLRRTARNVFGWRRLRPHQLRAMRALLRGRDLLVVLPTGAGKSAIYQVPGLVLRGPTLVISPLLALQQDQIAGLNGRRPAVPSPVGHQVIGNARTDSAADAGSADLTADPTVPPLAVRISSAETPRQQIAALDAVRRGSARFLFVTPEQLANPSRLAELRALRPVLVAVDEAHCL